MVKRHCRTLICCVICVALVLLLPQPVTAAEEPVHILLIGHDQRPGETGSRADCMVLCSYFPDSSRLVMTSFLRDLYVPIPGHGSNRLNAAYAFGGRELLKTTLEHNFGIPINGCVEVDFDQFAQLIDAVGGVELELRSDEAAHINRSCPDSALEEGLQRLNGTQALCYTRIRTLDPDGDFSRTRRQQAVLQALLRHWKDARPASFMKTARKLIPMISTDLDPGKILHWAFSWAPSTTSMVLASQQIPIMGSFRDEIIDGMSVLCADIAANRSFLMYNLK